MAQVATGAVVRVAGVRGRRAAQSAAPLAALPLALLELTGVLCLGLFLEVEAAMHPSLAPGGNPWAWVPVVFLPLGFLLAVLLALEPAQDSAHAFGTAMGLAVVVGVVGTVLHMAAHGLLGPAWGRWLSFGAWLGDPPIFAPMSFALLGVLGAGALLLPGWMRGGGPEGVPARRDPAAAWASLRIGHPWLRLAHGASGVAGLVGMVLEITGRLPAVGVLALLAAAAIQCADLVLSWVEPATWRVQVPAGAVLTTGTDG